MFSDPYLVHMRGAGLRRLNQQDLRGAYAPWRSRSRWGDTEASDGISLLKQLGLGMYRDQMGYHRIGFTNARHQHPHDRWLYQTTTSEGIHGHMYGLRDGHNKWLYLHAAHDRKQDTVGVEADPVVEDLFYLGSSVRRGRLHGLSQSESLRQLRLVGGNNYELLLKVGSLKAGLNYSHAHELLYHWDEWSRQHPEAAGMPRELVLRMHGLGPVLDAGIELDGYAK